MNEKVLAWSYIWIDLILLYMFYHLGILNFIYTNDTSFISVIILTLYLITNFFIIYATAIWDKDRFLYIKAGINRVTALFQELGMFGTVVGFIYMLYYVFAGLDLSNLETSRQVMITMTQGMSIALITTMTGLYCSMLTSIKMTILGYNNE